MTSCCQLLLALASARSFVTLFQQLRVVVHQSHQIFEMRRQIRFGGVERFKKFFIPGDDVTSFPVSKSSSEI